MDTLLQHVRTPQFQLVLLVYIAVAVLECSIALWAAESRRYWFLRALAVWLGVSLLIPVRAWEPALVFAIAMPLVVAVIRLVRWRRERVARAKESEAARSNPPPFQFGVRDILLATLLVGLSTASVMTILRELQPQAVYIHSFLGFAFAMISIAIYRFACGPLRTWASLVMVVPLIAGALLICSLSQHSAISLPLNSGFLGSQLAFIAPAIEQLLYAIVLTFGIVVVRVLKSASTSIAMHRAATAAAIVIGVPVAAYLAVVYWGMAKPLPVPPQIECPNNHYSEILAIAERVNELNPNHVPISTLAAALPNGEESEELGRLYRQAMLLLEDNNSSISMLEIVSPQIELQRSMNGSRSRHSIAGLSPAV